MTDTQLLIALRSMGMGCFVTHLALFRNDRFDNQAVAAELSRIYSAKAAQTRTSHARRILAAGRMNDALRLIASANVPDATRDAARAALGIPR